MESTKVQFNKNSEVRKKQRTKFLFIGLFLVMIIFVAVIALLRKPQLQIQKITIIGTQSLDATTIVESAQQQISGNYAWVIPKKSTLLFSKQHMKEWIFSEFPAIAAIDIIFNTRNEITISITEKKPESIWCRDGNDCYFIDHDGVLYDQAPLFSDGVYLIFSGKGQDVPIDPIRSRFTAQMTYTSLLDLVKSLEDELISTTRVVLEETGDISLRIEQFKSSKLSDGAFLRIAATTRSGDLIDSLKLLSQNPAFISELSDQKKKLESIDARFPGKIYYTFKSSSYQTNSASSSEMKNINPN